MGSGWLNMITIATRYSLDEALVLRSYLEGSGIPAFIPDEFMAQNAWTTITAIGGIRIQVPPEHEEAVRELIASANASASDAVSPVHCPYCDSTSVTPNDLSKRMALFSIIIFSLPLPFGRDNYICKSCGKKFKKPKA